MKVTLLNKPDPKLPARVQVLLNRGIQPKDIKSYLETTDDIINSPLMFGADTIAQGSRMLLHSIAAEEDILVIVDADCDGFTSSALLINYLYDLFPAFVHNHLKWFIHSGKQHGLNDCIDIAKKYKLVICPDSSSNDYEYHQQLHNSGINVLVLDHHEADHISEHACIINNQMSYYPNKELSGVGVTWQFCRYLDMVSHNSYADNYLDLVALGNMADMMSLRSMETKHLIFKGFKEENIKNPFIYEMAQKNSFSLGKSDYKPSKEFGLQFSPMGAAFFIAPFVNAMVRSGTLEEKQLLFDSMLKFKAFEMIPSTKRGHKPDEEERLVDQAIRTCTNVKNRQTRAQDAGVELLEGMIEKYNLLNHKVLLFLLEPGEIDRNIAGLIANKFMSKYQRPVCILTKVVEMIDEDMMPIESGDEEIKYEHTKMRISYQGSARGYDAGGFTTFKDLCAEAPSCIFAEGHQGAFGLGLGYDYEGAEEVAGEWIYQFLDYTDKALENMDSEPSYFVDYIWDADSVDGQKILDIADMNDFWGKDIDRSYVYIKNIKISADNFKVMKSNTLKYELPCGIDIIQFGGTEEQIDKFKNRTVTINAVCKCCANEWNWQINPQLQMVDYEIVEETYDWGF